MAKKRKEFDFDPHFDYECAGECVYTGSYEVSVPQKGKVYWTQAGDECEDNVHGNPAADVRIYKDFVEFVEDDGIKKKWMMEECIKDPDKVNKEIGDCLNNYYSQFVRQPMFIRKCNL